MADSVRVDRTADDDKRLLERDAELDQLRGAFGAARNGAGGSVVVCGAAGTGKTRLVEWFLGHVGDASVLVGGCDDLLAPRPLGPFRDMVRANPALADRLPAEPDREELLSALMGALEGSGGPTVVIVEDAHWADDATIDILRYLARRVPALPALLVITLRDTEIDDRHPANNVLAGPAGTIPTRIDLHPLSLAAVTELADDIRAVGLEPGLEADAVHRIAGGNPFLVSQLLASDSPRAIDLAKESLLARSHQLSTEGQLVLRMLSVLPDGADPTLARRLFGDRSAGLREAEASGLLRSTPTRIRFGHELGRSAVFEGMSFGERMDTADRAVDALAGSGADPLLLLRLAQDAGDGQRAAALAVDLLEGAETAEPQERWRLLAVALAAPAGLPPERVADLHRSAAEVGRWTNRHREALGHAERAVEILSELDGIHPSLAAALVTLADARASIGSHNRAGETLGRAEALLAERPDDELRVEMNTMLASAALVAGDLDLAIERLDRSIDEAETNGWSAELVRALGLRAVALGGPMTAGGDDDLVRALRLGRRECRSRAHATNLRLFSMLHLRNGQPSPALDLADEATRYACEHGFEDLRFAARVQRAVVILEQGRTKEAEATLTELLDGAPDPGASAIVAEAGLAAIWTRRGDPRAAERVESVWSAALAVGDVESLAAAGLVRAEHLWLEGGEEPLRRFAQRLVELGRRHRHQQLRADALRVLQRLGDEVEPFDGCPATQAAALAGDHRLAAARWQQSGQPHRQALELIESMDAPIAFEGLRLLDRAGAVRTADRARHWLRTRGLHGVPRGPRKTADGAIPTLTSRQADVLCHIAEGLTNQQIADELFVARRTVDSHVSAILNRMNANDRHEAVAEARARGLL